MTAESGSGDRCVAEEDVKLWVTAGVIWECITVQLLKHQAMGTHVCVPIWVVPMNEVSAQAVIYHDIC